MSEHSDPSGEVAERVAKFRGAIKELGDFVITTRAEAESVSDVERATQLGQCVRKLVQASIGIIPKREYIRPVDRGERDLALVLSNRALEPMYRDELTPPYMFKRPDVPEDRVMYYTILPIEGQVLRLNYASCIGDDGEWGADDSDWFMVDSYRDEFTHEEDSKRGMLDGRHVLEFEHATSDVTYYHEGGWRFTVAPADKHEHLAATAEKLMIGFSTAATWQRR